MIDQDVHRWLLTEQAACPSSWLWCAWHERHTSLCPQTIQWGTLLKPPGGQVQQCFGNECHSWNLELSLEANAGMVPCESKGQSTSGISGSPKAAIERNMQDIFRVRCLTLCSLLMHIHIGLTATVPGRYRWGFLMPPADGASFLAALVANALRGALPPVDLLAVWISPSHGCFPL